VNERDEALREALRTDALEDVHADLAEALAAVQRTATLAAQRATALAEMQRERDEAQRQLSEMVDRSLDEGWKQVGYDIERQERYRLAWTSARRRARQYNDLVDSVDVTWQQRCDELGDLVTSLRLERDEARAEVVHLGKEGVELLAALREARGNRWALIEQHRDLIALVKRREAAAMAEGAPEFAAATARLRAALDEERIEPEPGCPAHGVHPHGGRRCLDCPACVGQGRTEGEAG
jgi:hypothetical protein